MPDVDSNAIQQLVRRQGTQAQRRDRVRRAATLAVWPSALAGAYLLPIYGSAGELDRFVAWLLLTLAFLLSVGVGLWWIGRLLAPRIPPWPCSSRAVRTGAKAAFAVSSVVVVLLAPATPPVALIFGAAVAGAVVLLHLWERALAQRVDRMGHEVAMLGDYR